MLLLAPLIFGEYVGKKTQIPVNGTLILQKGQPLEFYLNAGETSAYVSLGEVQEAQKKPLEEHDVRERMNKTGETDFYFENLDIHMDSRIFVPNGMLNQIRRDALEELKNALLRDFSRKEMYNHNSLSNEEAEKNIKDERMQDTTYTQIIGACETKEQLKELLSCDAIDVIYADTSIYDLVHHVDGLEKDVEKIHEAGKEVYLRLPVIFRKHTSERIGEVKSELNKVNLDGVVVRNYEELYFVQQHFPKLKIVIDHNLYTYNDYAKQSFAKYQVCRDTIPLELNQKEIRNRNNTNSEMVVYGHYPLMVTAGCVHKNTKNCDKQSQITYLKDRYQVLFSVKNYCKDCYNIIYNSLPTLLFGEMDKLKANGIRHFRMDFTIETAAEVRNVLQLFQNKGQEIEATKGHYKRGVE